MVDRSDWSGERPSRFTGIDPGQDAGAVSVLDEACALVGAGTWKAVSREGRPRFLVRAWLAAGEGPGVIAEAIVPYRVSAVAAWLVDALAPAMDGPRGSILAVEDNHVGKNASAAVTLAQATGMVLAPFQEHLDITAHYCHPNTWRANAYPRGWAKVPRPPRGQKALPKREHLKRLSLKWMPIRCPGLSTAQLRLDAAGVDHLTESAGVAYWLQAQPLVW